MSTRSILHRRPHPLPLIERRRRVLLVAHPTRSGELLAWVRAQSHALCDVQLFADEATRATLEGELEIRATGLHGYAPLLRGRSGRPRAPDLLVLFWDPGEPQPRDSEVRALLCTAVRRGVLLACTRRAADFLLLAAPPHEEWASLIPFLDERRWAPELAIPGSAASRLSAASPACQVYRHTCATSWR